jgi:hypothetical protein
LAALIFDTKKFTEQGLGAGRLHPNKRTVHRMKMIRRVRFISGLLSFFPGGGSCRAKHYSIMIVYLF